jgi:hypothetical protein
MDWLANIPVYRSIFEVARDMGRAIKNESEEFDEDEEHTITRRDEVLAGLVAYLAEGHKDRDSVLLLLDKYCGRPDDAPPQAQRVSSTAVNGRVVSATLQCLTDAGWVDVRPLEVREDGKIVYSVSDSARS